MTFPAITTHVPEYEIEIIDVAQFRKADLTKKEQEIAESIPVISLTGFTIDREKFDILDYPSSDTTFPEESPILSSETALILLKKDGKVVGYNLIATALVKFEGITFQVNKVGPSSVLPEHRGHHFVDLTTTDFLEKRLNEAEQCKHIPFALINAVNEMYKKACNALLANTPYSEGETQTLNNILQASLPGVYPKPAYEDHEQEFKQGAIRPSHFAPRPIDQAAGVSSSEPVAEGKLFFIQLTNTVISNTRKLFTKTKPTQEVSAATASATPSLATHPQQLFNLGLSLDDLKTLSSALPSTTPRSGGPSAPPTSPKLPSPSSSTSA